LHVHRRRPHQRLLDLLPQLRGRHTGLDADQVGHALHARQASDDALGVLFLVLSLDFTVERDQAIGDRDVELFEVRLPSSSERTDTDLAKAVAPALEWDVGVPLDLVRHGLHATDPISGVLRRPALRIGIVRERSHVSTHSDFV
jgi:hypothetical protein